jgi:dihydroneopterin aldolase
MRSKWVISLRGIKIKAFHGLYEFEKKEGNNFLVDVSVKLTDDQLTISDLDSTVNYENLYKIVVEQMKIPTDLLEEVVKRIGEKILEEYKIVSLVEVSLAKLNPPMMDDCAEAKVTIKLSR